MARGKQTNDDEGAEIGWAKGTLVRTAHPPGTYRSRYLPPRYTDETVGLTYVVAGFCPRTAHRAFPKTGKREREKTPKGETICSMDGI